MHITQESTFSSFDGTTLFYRSWIPGEGLKSDGSQKAIILFHRGHEHSGRFAHVVTELNLPDYAFFAWDQRGHGHSAGMRGSASHLFDFIRDIDCFVQNISERYQIPLENMVVLGHSVSAVLVALWVKNYAPRVRGMILATPAFVVKLYVPLALPALRIFLWCSKKFKGTTPFIRSYVKGGLLTHDANQARLYDEDPLISRQIAVNILVELFDAAQSLLHDASAIITPTLVLCARADWVVKNQPQRDFFCCLSSPFKRVEVYKGLYHAIFHEKERAPVLQAVRSFIVESFEKAVDHSPLKIAHYQGSTYEEYQWLKAGLPTLSLRRFSYVLQQWLMKTVGRLSNGIRIGWKAGFDSGQMLDYVYRNIPEGQLIIGKLLDSLFLESIGWRGIRQRKQNLEKLLKVAIDKLLLEACVKPLRIVDVAGGPGRYILDVIKDLHPGQVSVLIRDYSETGIRQGEAIARTMGLTGVSYQLGDAFSVQSLQEITPAPDIVIVSGLYELFPDNKLVLQSLSGLENIMRPGAYLIYTNQPWHPQLETIAEVLTNRNHQPWVMRRRTQAEMDELVHSAGFQKLSMELDNDGIFTVSLAQRR